jgi:hypothetical protein
LILKNIGKSEGRILIVRPRCARPNGELNQPDGADSIQSWLIQALSEKSMRLKIIPLLFVIQLLLVSASYAGQKKDQKYESPDGKYIAHVIALPKAPYGSGESEIVIKTKKGKLLCSKNYGSETGEHGFGVESAAWTPDSRFFVYSMSSSGGHQSWTFPIYFISIHDNKVRKLDDYLGPVTDPEFELIAPDIIKAIGRNKNSLDEEKFDAKLGNILKSNKK